MYDIIEATLSGLKKYHVDRLVLSPGRWATFSDTTPLSWTVVKFGKSHQESVPDDESGVYSFVVKPEIASHPECAYLLYVGKAENQSLRRRFVQYFWERNRRKGRPKIQKMLSLWEHHLWFCYATVDDITQIHNVEQGLIGAFLPPVNNEFPAEVKKAMKAW